MSRSRIRFATDILRRLGEELNPRPDKGILELAKNAYDADAIRCTVELKDVDQPGGSIWIVDDGDGMDESDIEDGWLVLGKSPKSQSSRTRLGRIPAGNKGLGRLAALRMGAETSLSTRPREDKDRQYDLYIDWADYEDATLVEEVELTITESQRPPNAQPGTEILIDRLHSPVNRMDVKRLARELILLADPFGDDPEGFKPRLVAPEFEDLANLVQRRYFDEADYHLTATVDEDGFAAARVVDYKGEELFSTHHDGFTQHRQTRPYASPPAHFDLWVFLLDGETFSTKAVTLTEVRKWLREFGGVHLYENGLRVAPYGDPGNDWLGMNLSRARSPEERPSTNTVIGRVSIVNREQLLVQKTDRSGFIETKAFEDLRSFAQDALDWLADRRLEVAEKRRSRQRVKKRKQSEVTRDRVQETIERAPKEAKEPFQQAFRLYDQAREREVEILRREVQLYRTLSTAGITAATFAHESSGNAIKVIDQSIQAVERRAKKGLGTEKYRQELSRPISSIKTALGALNVPGDATLKLLQHEKRRTRSRVELHTVIRNVLETFGPLLESRDVRIVADLCACNPYIQGSEAAVESIVTNLLNNSLVAFEESPNERYVLIQTSVADRWFTLCFADNGPGIRDISLRDIWLPGKTTRRNGTGLGLTIVKDSVADLGGQVSAVTPSEASADFHDTTVNFRGAEIRIELPILGTE